MTTKSFLDCERNNLEKMKKYQLPNIYKKIGWGIFILSFIALFIAERDTDFKMVAKYGMLVGLLMASISKEKIEDELIKTLRMQSYAFAFIAGVFLTITHPLFSYLANLLFDKQQEVFDNMGDWQILWILLSVQVFYFELLKRLHK